MKRKLVSLMLVVSMTAAMVAGCGSDDKKAADNNAAGTEKTDDKEAASGSVYYLNFKPEQDQQWQDLAKAYTDETGILQKLTQMRLVFQLKLLQQHLVHTKRH